MDRTRFVDLFRAPKTGFVEVCGLSGAGKTQVLLDASCRFGLSAESRVAFIDTEGSFDVQRFWEIAMRSTGSKQAAIGLLDRLCVYRVFDALELQSALRDISDQLYDDCPHPLRLNALMVDSLAFPFRSDTRRLKECAFKHPHNRISAVTGPKASIDEGVQRNPWESCASEPSEMLRSRSLALKDVGKTLQEIAKRNVTVLVSNQMKWTLDDGLAPALGWSWQQQVARRILLERLEEPSQHRASVLIAAHEDSFHEGLAIDFLITEAGVQGDDELCNDVADDDSSHFDGSEHADIASEQSAIDTSSSEEPLQSDGLCARHEMPRSTSTSSDTEDTGNLVWPPCWWISRPLVKPARAGSMLRASHEDVLSPTQRLSGILHGRLVPGLGGILEVCGEAGTGKTQFCLQAIARTLAWALAVSSTTKSCLPCALYLYSEDIPVMRLREIAEACATDPRESCTSGAAILDSIFLERVNTPGDLYFTLCSRVPLHLQHAPIRIIVVDSITTLFRNEELDIPTRSSKLFSLACLLKRISCDYNVQVLVTNHVTANFETNRGSNSDCAKPALGHAWSSCVSHRISLYRTDRSETRQGNGRSRLPQFPQVSSFGRNVTRFARVHFSCTLPEVEAGFTIDTAGFQLENDANDILPAHSEAQVSTTTTGVGQLSISHLWRAISVTDEDCFG
eukprot:TRINITY_DN11932_c0_g1_i1.p1 TRINITY_DN11932_c0_g1~~TRINITY_DN11932_c0_g1_i1.p1  ORF type:complete len:680 (-),score=69.53 TRINITY_DN11932_c0_g1_i1:619-2658(-)